MSAPPTAPPNSSAPASATTRLALPQVALDARATWAVLRWLVPLAVLHGLLYLLLVPPWQHYDEPTNFEFARLIAERGEIPVIGDITVSTRLEIAESMVRGDFWRGQPQPMITAEVPFIGYDQRVHPPLYYILAAQPIRATLGQPVELQLYATRLVSVLFYTLSVVVVWRLGVVLAPEQPVLQLALPLIYGCVPPFTALMTAVNSDVLVNFTAATLLLACVLLIRDGPRPAHFALAILSLLVGVLVKRTALMGFAPLGLAFFWSLVRGPLRGPWLWAPLLGSLVLLPFTLQLDISGANVALGLRPWVNSLDSAYLRLELDKLVHSLTDWNNSAPVYPTMVAVAFTSYWSFYGWGNVPLGQFWTWALAAVSCVGVGGALVWLFQRRRVASRWQLRAVLLFLAVAGLGWVAIVLRLHPLPPYGDYFYLPRGRYMYGALAATVWLFVIGAWGLAPDGWRDRAVIGLAAFFVIFDSFGWSMRLISYYYGSPWPLTALTEQKPGIAGFPPLYLLVVGVYLVVLWGAFQRLLRAPRLD